MKYTPVTKAVHIHDTATINCRDTNSQAICY